MPLISVIVPVYKVELYLYRCVDSILAQTFTDFELILVDDGSPDNCGAICDEYAQKDLRVHVIHQENGGLSAARNAGIDWVFSNSDSEWITFVDSDDWVHPQYLEQLYRAAHEYDVMVSICAYEETRGEIQWGNVEIEDSKLWPVESYYVEHRTNATVAWGKLYHRECFVDVRYPVGKIHEDEYVTYRILFAYEKVAVIGNSMYAYYMNPEGIMKSEWTVKKLDGLQAYEEQLVFFKRGNYHEAYGRCARNFVTYLCVQYISINGQIEDNLEGAKRHLMKRLKRVLLFNISNCPFLVENMWIYETAFPKMMNAYWLMRALYNRVKKHFGLFRGKR